MRLEDTTTDILSEAVVESEEGKQAIVRNVALSSTKSRNGYTYSEKAYQDGTHLYENASVFIDHELKKPRERSVRDLAGTVINPRFNAVTKRMMGDIIPLSTESGRFFIELARNRPPNVSMSHVVTGKRNTAKTIVESIQEVLSVDVVTGAAATTSFSEQETDMSDQTVTVLQEQNKTLQDKIDSSRVTYESDLKEVAEKLTEKTKEFDELNTTHETLKTEHEELKVKLDGFEVKEKLTERVKTVQEELDKAELKGEAILTETFMNQLHSEEDAEKRAALIDDRKKLIEQATDSSAPFVKERKSTSSTFDAKEIVEKTNIYV